MTTLLAASALLVGLTAGSASAFIDTQDRTIYDIGFEADGRGYAGIFYSMPVDTAAAGHIEMVDNGVSKTMKSNGPLDVTAVFNGQEISGQIELDANWATWNDKVWDIDVNLVEGQVTGLKELDLTGTLTQTGEDEYRLDLSGYAVYNMQRVDLDLDGMLTLSEFSGVRAL